MDFEGRNVEIQLFSCFFSEIFCDYCVLRMLYVRKKYRNFLVKKLGARRDPWTLSALVMLLLRHCSDI